MKKLFLFFFALVVSIGTAWADKTIYLNPGLWAVDNPVYAAYVWDAGGNSWISLTNVTGTAYYKATIPDKWEKMILVRLDPSKTIGWDAKWQQTDDIVLSGIYDYTLFKITDWNGSPMGNSGYNVSHMNLSLLGSVLAKSDSQGTSPVSSAIDGNKGTNWETKHGVDDAFLIIDLGANVTFNTVKMLWQNAYGKAYNIYAVADGAALTDGVPTFTDADKVLVVNETINGSFPYEQTKRTASDVTARYIKWEGVERAMPYGYNMYELQFYNIGSQTLESLNLVVPNAARQDATLSACKVGENITINYEAFDAYGFNYYGTEGISYNATNGTITNAGVFTPSAAGPCTITATLEGKNATATVFAYTGDDLLLNKVASTNEGASGADLFTNGNWGDRGGLGSAIPAWTQYDLGAYYTIDFVMLKQEQANAKNYKIQFSHDGETWVDAYERTNVAGMNGDVWDYFYGNTTQNTDVRFIRFYSTEAATGYGISIYEIAAYGTKTGDVADNVAPVINTATVNATALGVTFTLKATDETTSNISYTITDGANVYNTNGANGTEIKYTVYGMAAATHSGVQIVANDGHNDSEATILADFVVPAIPDIPAITATETYLLWDGNNNGAKNGFFFADWGGGNGTNVTINEKSAYQINNFKWFGSQFTQVDVTPYDFLELDVFPSVETTTLAIVPINLLEGSTNQNEKGQQFSLTPGEWNKLKINIADFIAENKTTMTKFYQIKFVSKIANKGANGATDGFVSGNGTERFIVGNIYAYKETAPAQKTVTFVNDGEWDKVFVQVYDSEWNVLEDTEITGTLTFETDNQDVCYIQFHDDGWAHQSDSFGFVDGATYNSQGIPAAMGYYIVGSMTDTWKVQSSYKMTLNETAAPTVEYYINPLALTTNDQFKVAYSPDGVLSKIWYPSGTDNNYGEHGEITANGNYVIFFRPNADGGDGWYEKVIYVTSMIDAGVDATTGAHILQGNWDASKFASIDAMSQANSYDLTALTTSPEGTITTIQKNVLFICRADQNIAKNKVVANGDGTYTGTNIEILDYNEYNGRGTGMNTKISPITGPVAYHRVLPRAGIYLTQVVPFDVAVPADANAYEATTTTNKSGEITITFTEVTQMKAGVPYLMHATNGGVHFNANSIDFSIANKEMTDAAFKATYNIIDPVPANTYVMPKGDKAVKAEFLTAAANSYIPAFRGYVELPAQTDARINVVFDDATGIHAATTEQLEGIFNIYSIDGKLVRQNTESKIGLEKGIYIINGKKVVIK